MRVSLFFFIIILFSSWAYGVEPESNMLIFIPSIVSAKPNFEDLPHEVKALTDDSGSAEGCGTGNITHAKEYRTYSNSLSTNITIVEMKIIDPLTWQFIEPNLLPVTLAPEDTITFSISHINGYLCENPPEITKRIMFIFSDSNFQKV